MIDRGQQVSKWVQIDLQSRVAAIGTKKGIAVSDSVKQNIAAHFVSSYIIAKIFVACDKAFDLITTGSTGRETIIAKQAVGSNDGGNGAF